MTDVLERPTRANTGTGDPNEVAHIVYPKSKIIEAMVTGTAVEALCGHVFVPTRDPQNYPKCERCLEIVRGRGLNPDRISS